MKTDSVFYRLFQSVPQLFFALLDRPAEQAMHYQFTSEELKQTAFRIDGIFHPPDDQPDWPLFFVEVQFQLDPDLYSRLFAEVFLYLRQHRPVQPWQAVVIYPTRSVASGPQAQYQELLDSPRVTQVYLDEWAQPRQTLMQRVMGVLLAEPQQAIAEARAVLAREEDGGRTPFIVDLVETILVYKLSPTLRREEIQKMLNLDDVDLKQTQFYKDVFAEGREEGEQEGRQKGEQEGRQKGEQEGRQKEGVALILRLLQRRCGEVAPAMREHVTRLPVPQLEALGEALLDFQSGADLAQWLATLGARS
jgi:predicted transposase/invertase (TIGR01784 family)